MLRRLDLKGQWRSLDKGFWPDDLPLGCRTVVYGHNGSGKSTLAELLLSLAEGQSATSVIWEHDDKQKTTVDAGGPSPSPSMAVFTRKWVETNLSAFLDGKSASAIVTLGQAAIDSKEEEKKLGEEIEKLRGEAKDAEKSRRAADQKVTKLVREVQDHIMSELKEFDYNHFTKSRYSVPKVTEDLRKYKGEFPDSNAHAEALKRLGEGSPAAVPEVANPPVSVAESLKTLTDVLAQTPTRVALETLEGNARAQAWAEQGLLLHEELDSCLFCNGAITTERRPPMRLRCDRAAHRGTMGVSPD